MVGLASSLRGSEDWTNWRLDIEREIEIVRQELE